MAAELFGLQEDPLRIDLAPLPQDVLGAVLYEHIRNSEPFYRNIVYPSISKGLENGTPETTLKRIFLHYQNLPGVRSHLR
jgi:hypothetical protein